MIEVLYLRASGGDIESNTIVKMWSLFGYEGGP